MSIAGKLGEYASTIKKEMFKVVQTEEQKTRQAQWEAFVDQYQAKLFQFHQQNPSAVLPVAYHTILKKWIWLSREDQRKMNRRNAKRQRQEKLK